MAHIPPTVKTPRDRSKTSTPMAELKKEDTPPAAGKHLIKSSTIRTMPKESPKHPAARPTSNVFTSGPQTSAAAPTSSIKHRRLRTSDNSTESTPTISSGSTSERKDAKNKAPSNPDRARSASPNKATPNASSKRSSISSSAASSRKTLSTNAHPSVRQTTSSASAKTHANISSATNNAATKRSDIPEKRPGQGSASSPVNIGRVTPTKTTVKDLQTSPRKNRPALSTRKSTMSVTIEQRLREISVVHQMLKAAMADDGEEDDALKEEYGKSMDETLAALKGRLEEAKSAEGLISSGIELTETLSQQLESLSLSGSGKATPALAVTGDTAAQESHGNDTEKLVEDQKPHSDQLGKNDPSTHHDTAYSKIASKLGESHGDDKAKLELLREENDDLREAIRTLKSDWQETVGENSRISQSNNDLRSSIVTKERELLEIQNNLREAMDKQRHEYESHTQSFRALCIERDSLRQSKQDEAEQLQQTVESLEDHCQRLEAVRKDDTDQHRAAVAAFEEQIQNYEDAKNHVVEEHKLGVDALWQQMHEMQSDKDRELHHQSGVIEALQDQIRVLNENKAGDIEATRQSLAQELAHEHEEAISGMRTELEAALAQKVKDESESSEQLDQVRATFGTIHLINTQLQQTIHDTKIELEKSQAKVVSVQDSAKKSIVALRQLLDATRQQYTMEASNLHLSVKKLGDRMTDMGHELIEARKQAVVHESERDQAYLNLQAAQKEMQQLSEKSEDQQSRYLGLETDHHILLEQNEQIVEQLSEAKTKLEHHAEVESSKTDDLAVHEAQPIDSKEEHEVKLHDAHALAEKYHTRIQELESALGATVAELKQLQTRGCCSTMFTSHSMPEAVLGSNYWAHKGHEEVCESDETVAGEQLSSHVQGQVRHPLFPVVHQSSVALFDRKK
ncbi:MAG: hypothetical protein Q9194_006343 [Teloschistes cf. exilis]